MNTFAKLISIEWIKTRKRTVFWVAVVLHGVILGIQTGGQQYTHHVSPNVPAFILPNDWIRVIGMGTQVGMLMLFVAISLLAASERQWRTQRQNVIDGLSRIEYFCGKLIVVVALAVILWIEIPVIGIIFAALGGRTSLVSPVFTPLAFNMLGHALLYFIAIGSTAFMFGMLAASSGAALGLLFAFVIVEPILGSVMYMQGGLWPTISTYLPLTVFNGLASRLRYDPTLRAQMDAMSSRMGRPLPLSLGTSTLVTLIYIVAFLSITWLAFRKRDL